MVVSFGEEGIARRGMKPGGRLIEQVIENVDIVDCQIHNDIGVAHLRRHDPNAFVTTDEICQKRRLELDA